MSKKKLTLQGIIDTLEWLKLRCENGGRYSVFEQEMLTEALEEAIAAIQKQQHKAKMKIIPPQSAWIEVLGVFSVTKDGVPAYRCGNCSSLFGEPYQVCPFCKAVMINGTK